jgi:hypothetical protein
MGLFDFLGKKKSEAPRPSLRELGRLERLVSNKLSQNFDRQEAIEELGKIGTGASAAVLLKRFDWALDPSITDQEEKENCVRGIVAAGEDALEPIRNYCKRAESLSWPLKALGSIVSDERYVEELLAILDQWDTEYVRNPEPKIRIIAELEKFPSDDVRVAVEPFLGDMSEPVRFQAANTVFALGDEASVPAVVAALEAEESLRIKNRIARGLEEAGWTVPDDLRSVCEKALPDGFRLDSGRVRGL